MATQQPDDGTRQPGLGVQAWAGGRKEQFIRIIPWHVTGRRIRRAPEPA